MPPGRYVTLTLSVAALLVATIAIVNLSVDPYGFDRSTADSNIEVQNNEGAGAFLRKAFEVRRARPNTLLLGTSRMDSGIDPHSPSFSQDAGPVMNLGLGAVNIDQIRLLLVHAHRNAPVRMAIIGLDMESFLDRGRPDFDPAALDGNPESEPALFVRARIAISRETLAESVKRWGRPRSDPLAATATWSPVTPANVDPKLAALDGVRGLVWITEFNNFSSRAPLLFPRWLPGTRWEDDRERAASIRAFRHLLEYARRERIDLRMFISPVHARYLEWYERVGWWPLFESWKRALADAIDAEASADPVHPAFVLWDLSGYHSPAVEAVPRLGDWTTRMRWYRETSHYSHELGELVLARILSDGDAQASLLPDAHITRSTVEQQLVAIRRGSVDYRLAQPGEAANVTEMVVRLRRVNGK